MGALGLAALALWKNPRRNGVHWPLEPTKGRDSEPPEVADGDPFELPEEALESWVAGPEGPLRLVELHPEAPLAVVFVHGLGGGLEHWAPQLRAVGDGLRAIAFDLPGHGGSDPKSGGPLDLLAASLGAVLDSLGVRRVVVVAHSLGALAALRYAATHRDRVAGMLLVDPTGDQSRISKDERQAFLESLRVDPGGEMAWHYRQLLSESGAAVAERVLQDLAKVDDGALLESLASSLETRPVEDLEAYGGPVQLLLSDFNDLPYALHRLCPDLPSSRLPGSSHWLMLDRPDEVWESLLDFLGIVEDHQIS